MRVVVDAMGGDDAPQVVVEGAVAAARDGIQVILVGREDAVRAQLSAHGQSAGTLPIEVVHAAQLIEMHEHPASAVRQKKDSSIAVAMRLVREGRADAYFSAGNSGATMAAALFALGRLEGVHRPAIGGILPLLRGQCFLVDIGANTDCDPQNLLQFAQMGAAYMEQVYHMRRPRIGLVSNGEEETKGNALVQATYPLLKQSGLNFVGNVEGKDITRGAADVVVTDGFTGNVMLKLAEGMQELILNLVREAVKSTVINQIAGAVLRPALRRAGKRLDYTEYGGAPLIGVNGAVFIGHGRSDAKAIGNGIRAAAQAAQAGYVEKLQASLLAGTTAPSTIVPSPS
ncbi:MAG TPA: phosphate acyltransferase PlsX [Chloroflexota bacterium]|nr:phosphate acyltransferase PlsX [Chloroflexota bacterium]